MSNDNCEQGHPSDSLHISWNEWPDKGVNRGPKVWLIECTRCGEILAQYGDKNYKGNDHPSILPLPAWLKEVITTDRESPEHAYKRWNYVLSKKVERLELEVKKLQAWKNS